MDAVTATIVWGVVWFFLISVGGAVIYFLGVGLGALGALWSDKEWPIATFIVVGWLGATAWAVFAIIQVAIHITNLIGLLT